MAVSVGVIVANILLARRLTFLHNGRSERPTIVTGEVIKKAFA